jgi:hypothetical protein
MLKRGSQGEEVRKLQMALMEVGYELPRWGADGDLGTETIDVFARFLRDHSMEVDDDADVISDAELALLDRIHGAVTQAMVGPKLAGGGFHDLRSVASQTNIGGRRAWKQITGIVLHQTAVVFGEKPMRWASVGAHLGVTRGGQVIWMHDFEKVVWHGNGFNGFTIGIEVDGTYAGIEGEPSGGRRATPPGNRRCRRTSSSAPRRPPCAGSARRSHAMADASSACWRTARRARIGSPIRGRRCGSAWRGRCSRTMISSSRMAGRGTRSVPATRSPSVGRDAQGCAVLRVGRPA